MSSAQGRRRAVEEKGAGWSVFKAMGSILVAVAVPSPATVLGAGKSVYSHINNVNDHEASLLRAKDELNPITWRYLLKYMSSGTFVLKRGSWTIRAKEQSRGSYAPPLTLYEMLLANVGIDPSVCDSTAFKSVPDLPKLDVGVLQQGREGLTSSGWEQ